MAVTAKTVFLCLIGISPSSSDRTPAGSIIIITKDPRHRSALPASVTFPAPYPNLNRISHSVRMHWLPFMTLFRIISPYSFFNVRCPLKALDKTPASLSAQKAHKSTGLLQPIYALYKTCNSILYRAKPLPGSDQ